MRRATSEAATGTLFGVALNGKIAAYYFVFLSSLALDQSRREMQVAQANLTLAQAQHDKVNGYVAIGRQEGAEVLAGGRAAG